MGLIKNRSCVKKMNHFFKACLYLLPLWGMGGFAQSLDDYLIIAAENNPQVKTAYAQFEAAMQKVPQLSSLPDPTLTMSAFGRMVETRVGAQEAKFNLMQMFPWFGTLTAKKDAAALMADATFQGYLDKRNEVFVSVKSMYAEIYELHKMIALEEKNLAILNTYRELALSKFKNGKGAMVDVVRIDIKRNESETNIQLLKDRARPLQIAFNSMLNRDFDEVVNLPETLVVEKYNRPVNIDSLFATNPKMVQIDKQKAAFEAQKKIAVKEGYPMIGVGVDYSIISKRDVENLDMNGQDAVMPMVSVTLPIFRKKNKAAKKEAEFMIEASEYEKEATKSTFFSGYSIVEYDFKKAYQLSVLYEKQIESTQQAIKLLLSAYSNATTDFEEILKMNQDLLMYQTAIVTETKNQFKAQAQMDYLMAK